MQATQAVEARRERTPLNGADVPDLFAPINAVRERPELAGSASGPRSGRGSLLSSRASARRLVIAEQIAATLDRPRRAVA